MRPRHENRVTLPSSQSYSYLIRSLEAQGNLTIKEALLKNPYEQVFFINANLYHHSLRQLKFRNGCELLLTVLSLPKYSISPIL